MDVNLSQTEVDFILHLYQSTFTTGPCRENYGEWCSERGIGREEAMRSHRRLVDSGLLKTAAIGMSLSITADGILYVESEKIAEPDLMAAQDRCRRTLLRRGADEYESNGSFGRVHLIHAAEQSDLGERVCLANLHWLRDKHLIEFVARDFRITEIGLEIERRLRLGDQIEASWRGLVEGNELSVQARGHALEELLAEVARSEGLDVETRVRSTGEESDLVISQGHDHVLVSCKWEKKRAPNHYLESLRMRLLKRPGTIGLMVSVGGFSKELIKEAEGNTSLGLVMLFGRGDLERIFTGTEKLEDLMVERHRMLARYRKAVFED